MAITSYAIQPFESVTIVTVTSDLTPTPGEPIHFYWYIDGAFQEQTVNPRNTFALEAGDELDITVIDSLDGALDGLAIAPDGWPARRTIHWTRSLSTDVAHYRVEQELDGEWTIIGTAAPTIGGQWGFTLLTPRLNDLQPYRWRVLPIDAAGNEGDAVLTLAETIVRTPDSPNFAATFDSATQRVTFNLEDT